MAKAREYPQIVMTGTGDEADVTIVSHCDPMRVSLAICASTENTISVPRWWMRELCEQFQAMDAHLREVEDAK